MKSSSKFGLLAALGLAAVVVAAAGQAAVFNVDTTVDDPSLVGCDDATPNDCSLRGAIIKANALTEPVTINVPAGTYLLSQATPCFFRGNAIGPLYTTQALCPVATLNLVGSGADSTIIDANQPPGFLPIRAPVMLVATTASVRVRGVTMQHGNYSGSFEGQGGGINNAGTLVLEDSAVAENYSGAAGGGIYNQGDLTVLRSTITRNYAGQGGGGIWNTNFFGTCPTSPCHDGEGILTIANSTISENEASQGGGIFNYVGMVDIAGSTISGNVSHGGGGGIYNSAWNINLTNVTVSGNRANTGGGIQNQGPSYSTMRLNNVTITDNTAQLDTDPTRGIAGGLINGEFGTVALRNTIIAGNFAAGNCGISGCSAPGTDCFAFAPRNAALTSLGYNLVQNPEACDITGDTTGNITGQDPKLGVLANNGGDTSTHWPAPDSPAVDAGSPAAPGSGSAACAVADQRGLLRPLGPHCDMGAVERSVGFAVVGVFPAKGGNVGQVTVQIGGGGLVDGTSVKLSRAGQADILGTRTFVDIGGGSLATTFDLSGASPGPWDLVVTEPDATSGTLADGFTVQPGTGPNLWVDVIATLKRHDVSVVTIYFGNRGDADAVGVPLTLGLPASYQPARYFDITPPPAQSGERRPDWGVTPAVVGLPGQSDFLQLPLFLPVVPSQARGVLRIALTVPPNPQDTLVVAAVGSPAFTTSLDSGFIARAVNGAQNYVQQTFGTNVPAAFLPQWQQYAATQFQQAIDTGRAAFGASFGSRQLVYSLAQLQLDLAFFALTRTTGAAQGAPAAPVSQR